MPLSVPSAYSTKNRSPSACSSNVRQTRARLSIRSSLGTSSENPKAFFHQRHFFQQTRPLFHAHLPFVSFLRWHKRRRSAGTPALRNRCFLIASFFIKSIPKFLYFFPLFFCELHDTNILSDPQTFSRRSVCPENSLFLFTLPFSRYGNCNCCKLSCLLLFYRPLLYSNTACRVLSACL